MKPFETCLPEGRQKAAILAARMHPEAHRMEHRWGVRRACQARVHVFASNGLGGASRLRNISMSGAFLETALPLHLHSQLTVAVLRDDGSSHALDFPAVVVRHAADGVGIEWCDPNSGRICGKFGCPVECAFRESARGEP